MKLLPHRAILFTAPLLVAMACMLLYVAAPEENNFDLWIDINLALTLLLAGIWIQLIIIRRYKTQVGILAFSLGVATAMSFCFWFAQRQLLDWLIARSDLDYRNWLQATNYPRLFTGFLIFGWMNMVAAAQKRNAVLEEKLGRQASAAALLREAELFKLRQQLQPHFLFNSLNAISSLTLIAPDKAQEMIGRLSDFLRSSVRRESSALLPLQEELDYIESYLAIESVRFGDRLQVHIQKSGDHPATIPPFLLQPLVENAIKFGLYGPSGALLLQIIIHAQPGLLEVAITNPYDRTSQPPAGTGFGLEGVRRRLILLYGRADLVQTSAGDTHFTTTLKIPQLHV